MATFEKISSKAEASQVDQVSIDVTETLLTGKWTGIERVVRRLSFELQANADRSSGQMPKIRLVVAIAGRFYALNEMGAARFTLPAAAAPTRQSRGITRMAATLLSYLPPFLLIVQSVQKEKSVRETLRRFVEPAPLTFTAGDLVLLLDSYWSGTSSIAAARNARRSGATVISAIYDVIPITHPEFMARLLTVAFPRRMLQALRISHGAIAISRYSADQMRRWLGQRLPDLQIHPFLLGNDPTESVRTDERPFLKRYTMVGTIEPRKGHDLVLDAFTQRWAAGADCTLTIVGKMGWAQPSTRSRLAALAGEKRLRVIHDADDARLAEILGQTDAVIMASKIEGFGLPIVEALALDIPVIASDIPIFREIGGDALIPFDPEDSASLVAAMEKLERDPSSYRALAKDFSWPSWSAAALHLITILKGIAARSSALGERG